MSTLSQLFDLQEQLCYVQCGYCTTILLVSVPCSSLSTVVTVRCGHCTSLLSVNMMKAAFLPLHLFGSLKQDEMSLSSHSLPVQPKALVFPAETDAGDDQKGLEIRSPSPVMSSDEEEEEDVLPVNHVIINKPPEKRHRTPSAYNRFIREEIQRLKAQYPNMTHKQAFSTAAKNWAHFPPCLQKEGEG